MKILIVDDEAHIRRMMRLTLEAAGYGVEEAADSETGLERFGGGTDWDVVLLDQRMPGLDGLETLRRMKQRQPAACVVMVTAYASIDLAVDAMRLGATDFLRKPMTPEMLRGAVAGALAGHQRAPVAPADRFDAQTRPKIETLTTNGFRIVRAITPPDPMATEHVFEVTQFPGGTTTPVRVRIDPEAVARVSRLSRHDLPPGSAFWRLQAERLLAAYLWSEGRLPATGQLTVDDISREDLEAAAAGQFD